MQLKMISTSQSSGEKAVLSPIKTFMGNSMDNGASNGSNQKSRNILAHIGDLISEEEKFQDDDKKSFSPVKCFGNNDQFSFKLTQI